MSKRPRTRRVYTDAFKQQMALLLLGRKNGWKQSDPSIDKLMYADRIENI